MDKFDIFIKNVDMPLAQYTAFRRKKIAGLLGKGVFKVVTSADILSNAQIFNFYFVDKVKHVGTNKVYEKSWLIIQAYNNQKKDLVLI